MGRIGHLGIVDLLRFEQWVDAFNGQTKLAQFVVDGKPAAQSFLVF